MRSQVGVIIGVSVEKRLVCRRRGCRRRSYSYMCRYEGLPEPKVHTADRGVRGSDDTHCARLVHRHWVKARSAVILWHSMVDWGWSRRESRCPSTPPCCPQHRRLSNTLNLWLCMGLAMAYPGSSHNLGKQSSGTKGRVSSRRRGRDHAQPVLFFFGFVVGRFGCGFCGLGRGVSARVGDGGTWQHSYSDTASLNLSHVQLYTT